MKINRFTVYSAATEPVELTPQKPICFLRGRDAETVMDLMRAALGDRRPIVLTDAKNDGHFVLHADVEMDGRDFQVCYLRHDEGGDDRIAVNFREGSLSYSQADTKAYLRACDAKNVNSANVLIGTAVPPTAPDTCPLFIYHYFDRLDEAIDITPTLDTLASLGRQVFVGVCARYPDVNHESVQICTAELD